MSIVNLSLYRFTPLEHLEELQQQLRELSRTHGLRGTILLSHEGINLFVAGVRAGTDALLAFLAQVPGLERLDVKESLSRDQPFRRMLVKIKREIIAFGVPEVQPHRSTARRLSAQELKRWLDEGQPVTLLDTRNRFEVEAGTFRNAIQLDIDQFRAFPAAASERLPARLKDEPIVTFCTGGIRCEKASAYLEQIGFRNVFQLDGGILRYFEECGGAHYEGQCFVFDQRVALDETLGESGLRQCYACQAILQEEDVASADYVEGTSCPYCITRVADHWPRELARHQQRLQEVVCPLPGSEPHENVRPLSVPARCDGLELLAFLGAVSNRLDRDDWLRACAEGRLTCRGEPVAPGRIVRAGERLLHHEAAVLEPAVATDITLIDEDEAIVVVNKPAPLPMHPCGRFHLNTLGELLGRAFAPVALRPAHRLDADTTGLVVYTKSRRIARILQPQFERREVRKQYLARVQGHPTWTQTECSLPIDAEPGADGVRRTDPAGLAARTMLSVARRLDDGTTLVIAEPITGRTNQIRAHLWALGHPIVGDPVYLPDGRTGLAMSRAVGDPALTLHAWRLSFVHPLTGARVDYTAPAPDWAAGIAPSFEARS